MEQTAEEKERDRAEREVAKSEEQPKPLHPRDRLKKELRDAEVINRARQI